MTGNGSSTNGGSPPLSTKDSKDIQTVSECSPGAVDTEQVCEMSPSCSYSTSRRGTSYTDLDLSEQTGGHVRESSIDDVEYVTVRKQ